MTLRQHWKRCINILLEDFQEYFIQHISRVFNYRADLMSKKGLLLADGILQVTPFTDHHPGETFFCSSLLDRLYYRLSFFVLSVLLLL